jgi:hypothetical protein
VRTWWRKGADVEHILYDDAPPIGHGTNAVPIEDGEVIGADWDCYWEQCWAIDEGMGLSPDGAGEK